VCSLNSSYCTFKIRGIAFQKKKGQSYLREINTAIFPPEMTMRLKTDRRLGEETWVTAAVRLLRCVTCVWEKVCSSLSLSLSLSGVNNTVFTRFHSRCIFYSGGLLNGAPPRPHHFTRLNNAGEGTRTVEIYLEGRKSPSGLVIKIVLLFFLNRVIFHLFLK